MCGMVGMISKTSFSLDERTLFKQSLICDMLRGINSTGVFALNTKGELESYKKAVNGVDFLNLKAANQIVDAGNNIGLIGHNRASTVGESTSENAHPFEYEDITLIHNGTLRNQHHLTDHTLFKVDSANIAYSFSRDGVEETCKNMDGAYALIWHDKSDNTINALRNQERDLYLAKIKGGSTVFFVSEIEMLQWLAGRNKEKIEEYFMLKAHTQVKFHMSEDGDSKLDPEIIDRPEFERPVHYGASHVYQGHKVQGGTRTQGNVQTHPHNRTRGGAYDRSVNAMNYLHSQGLEIDKEIMFTLTNWVPCNQGKLGKWRGVTDDGIQVEIDHAKQDEFKGGEEYVGYIEGLEDLHSQKKNTIVKVFWRDVERLEEWIEDMPIYEGDFSDTRFIYGPDGNPIPFAQWANLVSEGCLECGDPIYEGEAEQVVWTMERKPICPSCVESYNRDFGQLQ